MALFGLNCHNPQIYFVRYHLHILLLGEGVPAIMLGSYQQCVFQSADFFGSKGHHIFVSAN